MGVTGRGTRRECAGSPFLSLNGGSNEVARRGAPRLSAHNVAEQGRRTRFTAVPLVSLRLSNPRAGPGHKSGPVLQPNKLARVPDLCIAVQPVLALRLPRHVSRAVRHRAAAEYKTCASRESGGSLHRTCDLRGNRPGDQLPGRGLRPVIQSEPAPRAPTPWTRRPSASAPAVSAASRSPSARRVTAATPTARTPAGPSAGAGRCAPPGRATSAASRVGSTTATASAPTAAAA